MNSSFNPRTLGTLALTMLVVGLIGVSALWLMSDANGRAERIVDENLEELTVASDTRIHLSEHRQLELLHILERDPATQAAIAGDLAKLENDVGGGLEEFVSISPQAGERTTAQALTKAWASYLGQSRRAIALSRSHKDAAARSVLLHDAKEPFEALQSGLDGLQRGERDEAVETFADGQRAYRTARTVFALGLVISIAIIGLIGTLLFVVGPLRRARASESYRRRFHKALEMAESEDEALNVVGRSLRSACPGLGVEVMLADSSRAHLEVALIADPDLPAPGCSVEAPRGCEAVRSGQTRVFTSSEAIDACPKLRDRPGGPCSAVCTPVTVLGGTIGVVHAVGPDGRPPRESVQDVLETTGALVGSRLGVIRALGQSQLQASTDPLTGLLNRRSLEDRVRDFQRARIPYVAAMADLDHFKMINDAHGHETGDRALRTFTRVLETAIRSQDVLGRYGGEEFVIVFPRCSVEQAAAVLDRARDALRDALLDSTVPPFTFSAGVTDVKPDDTFHDALRAADEALMAAKHAGRDRVVVASAIRSELLSHV